MENLGNQPNYTDTYPWRGPYTRNPQKGASGLRGCPPPFVKAARGHLLVCICVYVYLSIYTLDSHMAPYGAREVVASTV